MEDAPHVGATGQNDGAAPEQVGERHQGSFRRGRGIIATERYSRGRGGCRREGCTKAESLAAVALDPQWTIL